MSLFKKKKTEYLEAEYLGGATILFEYNYVNAKTFRGFKRLHVTVYKDYNNAEDNANMLLMISDPYNCVGQNIKLTGIQANDGSYRGISVEADGVALGTIWYADHIAELFDVLWSGSAQGVYVRVEHGVPHPNVSLFVKLP